VDDALRSLGAGGAGCGEILGKIVKVLEDAEAYASGLTLRGALERDRWVDYMASLVEAIASQDDRSRAVDILRRVREAVDDALRSLGAGGAGCGEILGKIVKVLEDAEAYASLASSLEGHEGDILECVVRDAGEALKRVVEARELLNRYIECIGGVK
jgi:hypothetical protein